MVVLRREVELLGGRRLSIVSRTPVSAEGLGAEAGGTGGAAMPSAGALGPPFRSPRGAAALTRATSFFSSSSSFSFCFLLPPPFSAVVAAGEYSRPAWGGGGRGENPESQGGQRLEPLFPPGRGQGAQRQ